MRPTLRLKIVSGFAVVALAAVAVGLVGGKLVGDVRDNDARSARDSMTQLSLVSNAQANLYKGNGYAAILAYGPAATKAFSTTGLVVAASAATAALVALAREPLSPAAVSLLRTLTRNVSGFDTIYNALGVHIPIPDPNGPPISLDPTKILAEVAALQSSIDTTSVGLKAQVTRDADAARARASDNASNSLHLLLWLVAAVGLGAIAFGVWLAGRIVRRVRATVAVLERVAEGDLTSRFAGGGRDEIGQMATALNTTLGNVHDVIRQIEADADNLSGFADSAAVQGAKAAAATERISGYVGTLRTASAAVLARTVTLTALLNQNGPAANGNTADIADALEELNAQTRLVSDTIGDRGLGQAAADSAAILAENNQTAARLAAMAGSLNAMTSIFTLEPENGQPSEAVEADHRQPDDTHPSRRPEPVGVG